ncbi:ABC transporter [Microbacterium candidum]|uniref:ABC transporter n=1 Tax=Microbacterium candidum TaxID=3041922 RepID=A0ABT7MXI8_9MICO|nr:ABC transporter [Microbacterium sp. ASV49]MDL9979154.1 ABC transporter [Microbacterium sp. ASV49]
MSDPQPPVGEPIEEPNGVDDVVGSAHEGLASAAAAGAGAASDSSESASADNATPDEEPTASEPASTGGAPAAEPDPWESPEAASLAYTPAATPAPEPAATEPAAAEPAAEAAAVTASEPAAAQAEPAAAAAAAATVAYPPTPQPIFVQAPESPRPRGNRAAAGGIGLVAAAAFAVLFVGVLSAKWFLMDHGSTDGYVQQLLNLLGSWALWTPVVVFFFAFWLLGAIINRGRWAHWAIWGLLVGFITWGGYALGGILTVTNGQFWLLTSADVARMNVNTLFLTLMGVSSFIIARELTMWFGGWAAARGKRVTAQNLEAQREYERTLEAGPQLVVP